eukprot:200027-Rhodomonas_salina.1
MPPHHDVVQLVVVLALQSELDGGIQTPEDSLFDNAASILNKVLNTVRDRASCHSATLLTLSVARSSTYCRTSPTRTTLFWPASHTASQGEQDTTQKATKDILWPSGSCRSTTRVTTNGCGGATSTFMPTP